MKVGLTLAGLCLLSTCQAIGMLQGEAAARRSFETGGSAPVVAAAQAAPAPVPVTHKVAEPQADTPASPPVSSNDTAGVDLTQGCDTTGTLTEDKWDRCQSQIIANLARKNGTSPEIVMRTLTGQ